LAKVKELLVKTGCGLALLKVHKEYGKVRGNISFIAKLLLPVFSRSAAGLLVTGRAVQCGTAGDIGETADRAGNGSC